jgi:hypothetical protein
MFRFFLNFLEKNMTGPRWAGIGRATEAVRPASYFSSRNFEKDREDV